MTVAGEQTGFLIDDDLHARNLRFWDGWAGGLPTFGAECRLTGAFQTLRWHAAKVGS
jgi:hypothetical protein